MHPPQHLVVRLHIPGIPRSVPQVYRVPYSWGAADHAISAQDACVHVQT